MSDEKPPEVGSRRRRREVREAREREAAAARAQSSVVRRLSSTSTATGEPRLFDQERQSLEDPAEPQQLPETDAPAPLSAVTDRPTPEAAESAASPVHVESGEEESSSADEQDQTATGSTANQEAGAPGVGDAPAATSASAERAARIRRRRTRRRPDAIRRATPVEPKSEPIEAAEPEEAPAAPETEDIDTGTESGANSGTLPLGADSPVGAASPETAAGASIPLTAFDEVVSPGVAAYELELDYSEEDHVLLGPEDDLGEDWDELEEYIEHDEHGQPVVVSASGFGRGYQTVTPLDSPETKAAFKRRQAKRRRRNITLTIALGGFAVLLIGFVAIIQQFLGGDSEFADYDELAGATIEFEVSDGEGPASVQQRLVDDEIVASAEAYQEALMEAQVRSDALHADTYELREQMPAADAVLAIFGEDSDSTSGYVVINAGTRVDDVLTDIASRPELDISLSELEELNEDPQQFGLPEQATTLEGFLAPGEYQPATDATAEEVLQEMVDSTLNRLEEDGITDPDDQWHVIIVASLITGEANHGDPDSYPDMASAIENRLDDLNEETDGLLQIDAAVAYGLGRSGDVHSFTDEERQDGDNPYNTYANPGLPEGPIGAPIPATIDAAADPSDTSYLYWVTVDLETGETRFNNTYSEHLEDVEVFEQYCDDNPDICSPEELESVDEAVPPGADE